MKTPFQQTDGNFRKRLVKRPKLCFLDVGLASWLLGIRTPGQMATHPLRGALFETFVVGELLKTRWHRGEPSNLFFWRDSNGNEVDIIAEMEGRLLPVEIKSGKTIGPSFFAGLRRWVSLAGEAAMEPVLVYGGEGSFRQAGVRVLGWRKSPAALSKGS